jgi:hypothetical protein
MIQFCNFQPGIIGLIGEYGDINDKFSLLTTNKTIFRIFFESYISHIPDIDKILNILHNEYLIDNFLRTNIQFITNRHKYKLFIIDIRIRLLLRRINIPFTSNTEILPILNKYLDHSNVSISLLISNLDIIELIDKLISNKYTITKKLSILFPLYKQHKQLIDKIINRGELLYNIENYTIPLLSLYKIENKPLLDKLLTRPNYSIREIVYEYDNLSSMYTGIYKKMIDEFILIEYELHTVIRRVNYYKKYC